MLKIQHCLMFLFCAFAFGAYAAGQQAGTGTITGVITDKSSAVVPNVRLIARAVETGVETSATSERSGSYTIPFLRPGAYELSADAQGFAKYVQTGITLQVGTTVTVNIHLEVGSSVQTVSVNAEAPLLQTSTSEIGQVIDNHDYTSLPLNQSGSRRDPAAFILLTPGVTGTTYATQVNGGESFTKEIWVGGASVGIGELNDTDPLTTLTDVEAIQEFKVNTGTYSADMGRAFGVVDLEFKSGTNKLHGEAYEFIRNEAFDAKGYFASRTPRNRQNEFGANLGGPIIIPKLYNGHDRTFFFADYSGYRNSPGASGFRVTVPTPQEKSGNFQGVAHIYDPATTVQMPDGSLVRQEFQCNGQLDVICPERISSISSQLAALLPDPEFPTQLFNFTGVLPGSTASHSNNITVRADHTISNRQNLTFSWNYGTNFNPLGTGPNPNGLPQPLSGVDVSHSAFHVIRLSHVFDFRPNLINRLTLGFNRQYTTFDDQQEGTDWPSKLGLSSLIPHNTMIETEFLDGGYTGMHPSAYAISTLHANTGYDISDTLEWNHGRQDLKFGANVRWSGDNFGVASIPGAFYYYSLQTSQPTTGGTGDAFASFLIGDPYLAVQDIFAWRNSHDRWKYAAIYIQDDYKIRPNLTFNLGLRYEVPYPHTETNNKLSTLDPALPNPGAGNYPGALVYAGDGNDRCNCKSFTDPAYREFGPRLGFAYQFFPKDVLRGGYAIFYTTGGNVGGNAQTGFPIGWTAVPETVTPDGYTPAYQWNNPFPYPPGFAPPPDLVPEFGVGGSVNYTDHKANQVPYYQNWNLNLQHAVTSNLMVSAAYVGSKGTRLQTAMQNPNQVNPTYLSLGNLLGDDINSPAAQQAIAAGSIPGPPYSGFAGTVAQSLRPFPQYQSVSLLNDLSGDSTYHSLQVTVQKRYSQGLQFLVGYTLSKSIDNLGANGLLGGAGSRDQYHPQLEKSLSLNDIPQRLVFSYAYGLPFGHGQKLLNHGAMGRVAGGWEVSGIQSYQSGQPMSIVVNNTLNIFSAVNYPNLVAGVSPRSNVSLSRFNPAVDKYINPAAFADPAPFTIGTAPRTLGNLRTPASYNEDLAISKRTYIGDRFNVEFRAEAFNALNRVIFAVPSTQSFDSLSTLGVISGQANTRRELQFALKLSF